ncbi:2-succinyl-5-enolpyruvyl-6-hydroxy-3-cyclohexene-1-carboxylic-acid synthase [Patiriisocius hiemis]|uniref:2-succinyl-5-enolpyruvyl-6-hydroxy-3-cyclohexene-1-carboxylate synthase n=1 Tax=Patiriisocius hiemis TaxID=3075604 RepID=A0ABU2YFZ1_9FLAO|nr:2-succinyl-5-enolpyruvyl-6-hydroxy-3-cyclohexene-1-carboxylic-acid synthase [Constantimarinum sp. W242]MDT0556604.1 2-succinyl-5-enolpyruvyl-6-hydroxy-3-cyclohexene-1-carboxylic-acid synthase [Constantimarinum sp. W242]
MHFSDKILSQTVTQLCLDSGVTSVVISPGSRNAPLTIGFTLDNHFNCYSIVDERCAAFFALGIAQQTQKPVALVCTSGSALLNYYPAIAEAFYSDIPLVVISADRPEHLIEVGDGQTIMQENVYGKHILYNANCKEGKNSQSYNEEEIGKALIKAVNEKGPVHINVPFSEPLYNTSEKRNITTSLKIPKKKTTLIYDELDSVFTNWNKAEKKMILVGVLPPNSIEEKIINKLAANESVLVLTETTSNLKHSNFINAIDQLIAPLTQDGFMQLQPDILLSFGGMVVSKKIKAFLRNFPPKFHYHVDAKKAYNTYFTLDKHVKTTPSLFLKELLNKSTPISSTYRDTWLAVKSKRLQGHNTYLNNIPFSDFSVYESIVKNLSKPLQLQLANSTAIRYSQLFTLPSDVEVFCNRGTSGIDGSTSTAIGAAVASKLQTLYITGDLSFFYDSNALWNNYIPSNFRIILLNNKGGGIFRILPKAKESAHFTTFFETKHDLTAKQLCELFNFDYLVAKTKEQTESALKEFYKVSEKPRLLEVFTPSEINDEVLLSYFKAIK